MIKIVYAGNDRMAAGVFLSAVSMARRTKEDLNFYMLTMDFTDINPDYYSLSQKKADIIDAAVREFNPNNKFEILDCTEVYNRRFSENKNEGSSYSPYTLLRMLIPDFDTFQGKIIYLDADTMVCGDIKELYDIDLTGQELGVCHDYLGKFCLKADYFNAGVLLINMDEIRKTKLFENGMKMLTEKKLYFGDQAVLNKLVQHRIFFPDEFRFNEQRDVHENTVIKHFCKGIKWKPFFHVYNIKQWQIDDVHKKLKIHTFDEDFEFFLKAKNAFEEQKRKNHQERNEKNIVQIRHLRKSYETLKAVDDISFDVERGSLFSFLGENGAGKSTTINIIASILEKDSGLVIIDGHNLDEETNAIKKEIGIVFQNSVLDDVLTVEENILTRAKFYGLSRKDRIKRLKELSLLLNLTPILKQPVKKLSGGQRRRVDIARSMIHKPKLLILDEPTTGLDPKTRLDVWHMIDKLRTETNMTVFLTTHYLEEAERATNVVIMDHGHIIAEGTPTELKNLYSHDYVIVYAKKNHVFDEAFKGFKFGYSEDSSSYNIIVKNSEEAKKLIEDNRSLIGDFEVKKGSMDDVFLNLTEHQNPKKVNANEKQA